MSARPALVGLVGKKRVGKDTFAAALVERHGFTRVAFADPLREAALAADPYVVAERGALRAARLSTVIERHGWEGVKESLWADEVRRLLQNYGVAIREIDPGFWVRAGLDRAHGARYGGSPVVVTDVRFPNEAEAITNAGGVLVRVHRPGLAATDSHVSETALDDWPTDFGVLNDVEAGATIDDLARAADGLAAIVL